MRYLLGIILIYCFYNVSSQTTFAKIMDFNNTPQYADQLVEYKGDYYMAYTQVCIDEDGDLFESCGGVIKLDNHANVLDSNLIRRFSDNPECLVIDSIRNKIYLTGEEYFKQGLAKRYQVNIFDLDNFIDITQLYYQSLDSDQENYFQYGAVLWGGKLLINGSSRNRKDIDVKTLLFITKNDSIENEILLDYGLNTIPMSTQIDKNGLLTMFIYRTDSIIGLNDKSIILKLDTNYQEVWRWESPKLGQQLPFGCQLSDGRLIVAMHTPSLSSRPLKSQFPIVHDPINFQTVYPGSYFYF